MYNEARGNAYYVKIQGYVNIPVQWKYKNTEGVSSYATNISYKYISDGLWCDNVKDLLMRTL